MIKLLKIKKIEKNFFIKPGLIYNIDIENSKFYYELYYSLITKNEDIFIYSIDNELIPFYNNYLLISDLFNLDPNSKKILSCLYNKINSQIINNYMLEKIDEINSNILELFQNIAFDLNTSVDYDTELNITRLLTLYKFSFKSDNIKPLERIITYIKANLEIISFDFIITINITSLFDDEEINLLSKELELLGLALININFIQKNKSKITNNTTIDIDLCEF